MWSMLDLVGYGGLVVGAGALLAAAAAFVYVPAPFKSYVVAALLLAAAASQIYSAGYSQAAGEWQAKYDRTLASINSENQKAVIAAQQEEQAKVQQMQDAISEQVNQLAEQGGKDQDELDRLRAAIALDKTSSNPLDPGIRHSIHGDEK